MKKRVLALTLAILAFFIFVGSPFQQAAEAVAIVDDALIAIVVAALAACGIVFASSGSFGDTKNYVRSLLDEYAAERGLTTQALFSGVNTGSNNLGQLLLNNRFVLLIDTFAKWLVLKFSLADNATKVLVAPGHSIGDFQMYGLPLVLVPVGVAGMKIQVITADSPVYCIIGYDNNYYYINYVSLEYGLIGTYRLTNNEWHFESQLELVYSETNMKYTGLKTLPSRYWDMTGYSVYNQSDILEALNQSISSNLIQIDVTTTTIDYPTDNSEYDEGDGAILDVGGLWGDTYDDITNADIPSNYEDSTLEYDEASAIEEQVTDTPSQSISQEATDYQVNGLASVFPFCIPFDLFNFVSCLAADPVAPSFTWRFYVPGICDESIEIDLSEFDAAARILRTMELLLFCVGLAFVTRKIIRG